MNTITVTDKDTGKQVPLTQLRHRVLLAQGALHNYYPDAPIDWPEDSSDINTAPPHAAAKRPSAVLLEELAFLLFKVGAAYETEMDEFKAKLKAKDAIIEGLRRR